MGWVHDTGYGPALTHEGWAAAVLDSGGDTSVWSDETTGPGDAWVTGWRAACECGWRESTFYRRSDHPDSGGFASSPVEERMRAEWGAHLYRVVPELAVYDASEAARKAEDRLVQAVRSARAAGTSWVAIGEATGVSRQAAWERWRHLDGG